MRVTLEKADLIQILEKHFEIRLKENAVNIRIDPLEIEISGVPLVEEDGPSKRASFTPPPAAEEAEDTSLVSRRADANASSEVPTFSNPTDATTAESLHPAAMLEESKRIQAELDAQNPNLAKNGRRLGGTETFPGYDPATNPEVP